jgi:hypothetical protein
MFIEMTCGCMASFQADADDSAAVGKIIPFIATLPVEL